jgi:hypothetical protein
MKIRTKLFYAPDTEHYTFETDAENNLNFDTEYMQFPANPTFTCVFDDHVEYTMEYLSEEAFRLLDFEWFQWNNDLSPDEIQYHKMLDPKYSIARKYAGLLRSPRCSDIFAFENPMTKKWTLDYFFGHSVCQLSNMKSEIQEKFFVDDTRLELRDTFSLTFSDLFSFRKGISRVKLTHKFVDNSYGNSGVTEYHNPWISIEDVDQNF